MCTNRTGEERCHCLAGYTGNGLECIDVNECSQVPTPCSEEATCNNTVGSFNCTCNMGFTGNGTVCEDIDECLARPPPCPENNECINGFGFFHCQCAEGYSPNDETGLCEDVNECSDPHSCPFNISTCQNTNGSFTCTCVSGYTGGRDGCENINECVTGGHNCHSNANCTDSTGSFECRCQVGYQGNGTVCTDDDECSPSSMCHQYANCANSIGSFSCQCRSGFSGNGFDSCVDVNECEMFFPCSTAANCSNSPGSYSCVCNPGYTGTGEECTDVEECLLGLHSCNAQTEACMNTPGSFTCDCREGFERNSSGVCVDRDECNCVEMQFCPTGPRTNCTNTFGSFICACIPGYQREFNNCFDEDECTTGTHDCSTSSMCNNTEGSFTCTCNSGYTGNGRTCSDIDECLSADLNNCGGLCECRNLIGLQNTITLPNDPPIQLGYECVAPIGFFRLPDQLTCEDVNECTCTPSDNGQQVCRGTTTPVHNCNRALQQVCVNTVGNFTCPCASGFFLDMGVCRGKTFSSFLLPLLLAVSWSYVALPNCNNCIFLCLLIRLTQMNMLQRVSTFSMLFVCVDDVFRNTNLCQWISNLPFSGHLLTDRGVATMCLQYRVYW